MSVFYCFVLAFIFNYLGMCCFALTIERNQKLTADWKKLKEKTLLYKVSGWVFLAISLVLCVIASSLSMAILLWMMLLTLAGVVVAMLLCFHPSLIKPLYK
jgi:uncharacterized protein YacL